MPYDEDEVPDPFPVLVNQIRQRIIENWTVSQKNDLALGISVDDIVQFAEQLCLFGDDRDDLIGQALDHLHCTDIVPASRHTGYLEWRRVTKQDAKGFKRQYVNEPSNEKPVVYAQSAPVPTPVSPTQRPLQQLNVEFDPAIPTVITYRDDNGADITTTGYFRELTVKGVLRFTFGVLLLGFLVGVAVFIV